MPNREPIAAGRFYSGTSQDLQKEVRHYLQSDQKDCLRKPWGFMLPHAGYIYSGSTAGKTLADSCLDDRIIILCPNHTGRGTILSVWPEGHWRTPLGEIRVDTLLAEEIIGSKGGFSADTLAHLGEHSIEVLLPFLQIINPNASIVPICVGTQDASTLERAGNALARILLENDNKDVQLIISSDMNHYEAEQTTLIKDELALNQALAANPAGLLKTVRQYEISMCGAAPLALALYAAKAMGGVETELVAHSTSGDVSGDHEHVVGYAGLRFFLQ